MTETSGSQKRIRVFDQDLNRRVGEDCYVTSNSLTSKCRDPAANKSTNSWTRIHDIEGFARNIRRTLSLAITNAHFY